MNQKVFFVVIGLRLRWGKRKKKKRLKPKEVEHSKRNDSFQTRYPIKAHNDAIQPSKDPLEVPVGPFTRFRAKKFKEAFNGILQDTWAKVDFKRICNNKEQALINLIHVQEGLVGGTKTITQGLGEED